MPIQFQSVGAPNLDSVLIALNNAYANQQTNLNNLVKVGTDFGATAQANNDTNIKEYINGVLMGTVTHPSWPSSNGFLNIGHDYSGSMTGYISNFRFRNAVV